MMTQQVYAIWDKKGKYYGEPLVAHNDGVLIRTLQMSLAKSNNMIAQYPDDYDVYCVGEWESGTGKLKAVVPYHVCTMESVLGEEKAEE